MKNKIITGNRENVKLLKSPNILSILLSPNNSFVNSFALIDNNKYCIHNVNTINVGKNFFINSWIQILQEMQLILSIANIYIAVWNKMKYQFYS